MSTRPPFSLKWNNYQSHITEIFLQLFQNEAMVDVTLSVEKRQINAHRIVLSACSPYFQKILTDTEDKHPIVILPDMYYEDIKLIIDFIYRGELNVGAEQFTSVLKAAEELQITGLMEVSNLLPTLEENRKKEVNFEVCTSDSGIVQEAEASIELLEEEMEPCSIFLDAEHMGLVEEPMADCHQDHLYVEEEIQTTDKGDEEEKKKRRRRESCKKYYSEDMLALALEEVRNGRPLCETAAAHQIPRSTLYVRARTRGVPITITRQGHSVETVQSAIQAVVDGASLQQAAEMYKIPKTVLWRRVRKQIGHYKRRHVRHTHKVEKMQEAMKALEKGENLTKVAAMFKIPKTTLFREKARLVDAGKLPESILRRRTPDVNGHKKSRLSKAVQACKDGIMSQAIASITYQVPKTTIWRNLKRGNKVKKGILEPQEDMKHGPTSSYEEVATPIPVTYIDGTEFTETALILLTTTDENDGEQIIVDTHEDQQKPIGTKEVLTGEVIDESATECHGS